MGPGRKEVGERSAPYFPLGTKTIQGNTCGGFSDTVSDNPRFHHVMQLATDECVECLTPGTVTKRGSEAPYQAGPLLSPPQATSLQLREYGILGGQQKTNSKQVSAKSSQEP